MSYYFSLKQPPLGRLALITIHPYSNPHFLYIFIVESLRMHVFVFVLGHHSPDYFYYKAYHGWIVLLMVEWIYYVYIVSSKSATSLDVSPSTTLVKPQKGIAKKGIGAMAWSASFSTRMWWIANNHVVVDTRLFSLIFPQRVAGRNDLNA